VSPHNQPVVELLKKISIDASLVEVVHVVPPFVVFNVTPVELPETAANPMFSSTKNML
jgi:hypothetical protein